MSDLSEEQVKKRHCELSFERRSWSYAQTLSWVKWRSVARITDSVPKGEAWYDETSNTRKVVSNALKDGLLCAIKDDGSTIPSTLWHGFRKENDFSDEVCFSRSVILALWPPSTLSEEQDLSLCKALPKKTHQGRGPTSRLIAEKLISDSYPEGVPTGVGPARVHQKINDGRKGSDVISRSTIARALKTIKKS